ncbi:MAG TPA: DUF3330 domain-containing protein [Gammaproteobacteria bacterium]|nr:DUF3330 domain-containing protein [Gammaproteobacteria bacterium]
MNTREKANDSDKIACSVCLKEIPASGAKSDETSDYVRHFCGLECYDKWKAQQQAPKQDE